MRSQRQIVDRSAASIRHGAAALAALVCLGTSAEAAVINFPTSSPSVSLDVPDGWTVTYTPAGLEVRSPEKNSLIVANVVKRDERSVEAWAKEANKAMVAEGVTFDKNVKPARILIPQPKADRSFESVTSSSGEAFSFSGAPSIQPSYLTKGGSGTPGADASVTGDGARSPLKPFKVVQTFGATAGRKPIDIELAMYALAHDQIFVIEQQSGQTDGRAVAIVRTLKLIR